MKFSQLAGRLMNASLLLLCLLTMAACGGGIGGSGAAPNGSMRVSITDAPSCGYDEVNVTITKIRVNQIANAVDQDSGWVDILLPSPQRIDLLTLTNGTVAQLGQAMLPTGKYTQLRLILAENSPSQPLANSVLPTGGVETPLSTPSAANSGLKINMNVDVPTDKTADVVLDFNACKSVVRRGNSGQYNLKPVISATVLLSDAGMRVIGYVTPSMTVTGTSISLQANGVPIKATGPDSTGRFVLYPVPAGTYDLVVTSSGHVTAVVTGVPVTTTSFTTVNTAGTAIAPPVATFRAANGTVSPPTATVRTVQALNGGPTIETEWVPVDAVNGTFSVTLPIEAPVKASYTVNPTALAFVADPSSAGLYSVEAELAGVTRSQAINANATVPMMTFAFP